MADVARLAGVATSTVSRALGNPGRVNKKTRLLIQKAATELGYSLNMAARNLRTGSTRMILVVLPPDPPTSPIVLSALRGVDAELVQQGYSLIIGNFDRLPATEAHIVDLAFGGMADGVIVISSNLPVTEGRSLLDAGLPIVSLFYDLSTQGITSVTTDDREGMRTAASHLIGMGHKRIFYVGGPPASYHERERFKGLQDVVSEAGLDDTAVVRFQGAFTTASGHAAANAYLSVMGPPTGILCCNDYMAIAFMKTARAAGLRIPDDISVVGFDGIEWGEFADPPLTTVVQPSFEIGVSGARLLLSRLNDEDAPQASRIVVKSSLAVRQSSHRLLRR
jgi:LacI family repressor for deo operon, udp, cdd, tsx, nupC, and nupG